MIAHPPSLTPRLCQGSGKSGSGEEVSDSSLLDAENEYRYPEVVRVESSSPVPLVSASMPGHEARLRG
jgi:hypothetical protein